MQKINCILKEEVQCFYNFSGEPISSILLAPAVTPWETTLPGLIGSGAINPSIRLLKYNRTSGTILDVQQYYMNLSQANQDGTANWTLEYTAKDYNLEDMGTQSLHMLAEKLKTDDEMFKKYLLYNGVKYNPDEECDKGCRAVHYCAVTQCDYQLYEQCYTNMTKVAPTVSSSSSHNGIVKALILSTMYLFVYSLHKRITVFKTN